MLRSWKIGTWWGIAVYLHWTLLLLLGWMFVLTIWNGTVLQSMTATVLLASVFGCVLLHEFGHALTARAFGIATRDITLYPIGGVARLERMSDRPLEEILIALAGPAVNLVLAVLLGILILLGITTRGILSVEEFRGFLGTAFLSKLLMSNVLLAFFNLLPAFPMDGGRVLRSLLTLGGNRVRATERAVQVGLVVALGIGLLPIVAYQMVGVYNPIPILIALFVYFAGQQELRAVRQRERMRQEPPLDVLPATVDSVIIHGEPSVFASSFDGKTHIWVRWCNGQPIVVYSRKPE